MSRGFAAFIARRLLAAVALVIVVSSCALLLMRMAPGDATTELALAHVDAATLAATRAELGLDRPAGAQLLVWMRGLSHFDLGRSSTFGRPVTELLGERVINTSVLAVAALGLALAIGLPLGVMTGARPRGILAALDTPISIALVSCPPIVGALGLMAVAVQTGWLSISPGALLVPLMALALPLAAMLERVQSQATTEVIAAPGWGAAAARGLSTNRILWVHSSRQAVRPVLGLFGVILGSLFSGSLAVEWITSWPGLGRLMYDAIVTRDLFLVAGCALMGAVLIATGNFIADVLRGAVDPRVRMA
jgi:peptide/nickel transport system permease protein